MESTKDWQSPPQSQQQSPQEFSNNASNSTAIPTSVFNNYQNWPISTSALNPQFYSFNNYTQLLNQQQMPPAQNSLVSQTLPQSPLTHPPNMGPFFPYSFHNSLQPSPFSGISPTMAVNPIAHLNTINHAHHPKNTTDYDRKRPRITYDRHQVAVLENCYRRGQFVSAQERIDIAQSLNVSPNQIRIWFQNRRARDRQRKHQDSALSPKADCLTNKLGTPRLTDSLSGSMTSNSGSPMTAYEDSGIEMNLSSTNSPFSASSTNAFGYSPNISMYNSLLYQQQNNGGMSAADLPVLPPSVDSNDEIGKTEQPDFDKQHE